MGEISATPRRVVVRRVELMGQPTLDVRAGYAQWSETYDREDNPLIRVEERTVGEVLTDTPAMVLSESLAASPRACTRPVGEICPSVWSSSAVCQLEGFVVAVTIQPAQEPPDVPRSARECGGSAPTSL